MLVNESKITMNTAKHMSNNIKIVGLFKALDEDPMLTTEKFFKNIMKIQPQVGGIIEASRMQGTLYKRIGGKQISLPRLMYVKCSPTFRKVVDANKDILVGKKDEATEVFYKTKNHLPEAHYVVRIKYNSLT